MMESKLWYNRPAEDWLEALPLGNGRIGAMAFAGVSCERIGLNEDTFWSGYPKDKGAPGAAEHFARARALAIEGRFREAQEVVETRLEGGFTESFLPFGDLIMTHYVKGETSEYVRALDLERAMHTTRFLANNTRYERILFASQPDQVLALRVKGDRPGAISLDFAMDSQVRHSVRTEGERLILDVRAPSHVAPAYQHAPDPIVYADAPEEMGMRGRALLAVRARGGSVRAEGDILRVRGADSLICLIALRTSFAGYDKQPEVAGLDERALAQGDLDAALALGWDALLERHVDDYARLYESARFILNARRPDLPTDERLERFLQTEDDPGLYELIFHYGRYLMIASSRSGTQAMNLQGIWNAELRPPWSSNYTLNINTEMNYWPAERCGLPQMHQPLFELVERLRDTGGRVARTHYGASGATAHHNSDLWGLANPVGENTPGSAVWAEWPLALGWLCAHLYEHYAFCPDEAFLRAELYPALRDAARFFLDAMAEDQSGRLTMAPATSPENQFFFEGRPTGVARSSTMSDAIVREVLERFAWAARRLNVDEEEAQRASVARDRIAPAQMGSKGQLLEWDEEYEEVEPHHRHCSHLYALYPGRSITLRATPELAEACRRSLELRGDEGTGWSLGWKINLWARLGEGDHALKLLKRQLRLVRGSDCDYLSGGGTYPNLLDAHPPFQIDGNFGACAGIAEMLLQEEDGALVLLPALPSSWPSGRVDGLRAHGDWTVGLAFEGGKLEGAVLRAGRDGTLTVCYAGRSITITVVKGEVYRFAPRNFE